MASSKTPKFYVVWQGRRTGIFDSWDECKKQIDQFPAAKYKSFPSKNEAEQAFKSGFSKFIGKKDINVAKNEYQEKPILESLCVDAACSGNPGNLEYKGVYLKTRQEIFYQGVFKEGTNNIGEFLAIVHALAYLKKHEKDIPIYSDSINAISWVHKKRVRTQVERTQANKPLFELIDRAEKWLKENQYPNRVLKWKTDIWGENPADFGRK